MIDLSTAAWRKSIRSQEGSTCVEVANLPGLVAVRDSKDPEGPAFVFGRPAIRHLLDEVKAGKLDL